MSILSLEAAIDKIGAEHDFTSISVGRMVGCGSKWWTATVHWEGYARSGNACASCHSDVSIEAALTDTIAAARADRMADIAIPALELAA